MAISNRYSSMARPDVIITEYRFLIHHMEKGIRKHQKEFDRVPTVESKTMAISNRYSSLARPDLIIEYRFLIHSMQKVILKTPVRVSPRSNGRIKSYGHFEPLLKPGATRPHHHRVSIPHPRHGKRHPENPVRV